MDGSAVNQSPPGPGFGNDVNTWNQQVDFQSIKVEPQSSIPITAQPYTPATLAADTAAGVKAELQAMDNPIQSFSQMERLSSDYTPDIQGPLIGPLKSSKELEAEYANADPAFIRKTIALSPNYSYYRTVKGDGNCGWRAVAFGFFEILMKSDLNNIGMQHARIKSLNGLMNAFGIQPYIYEDFADTTFDIFIALCGSAPYNHDDLLKSFNDPGISDSIITHMKLLTSAWMKSSPESYMPFLEMKTVQEYCSTHIEPYSVEIDHVGLMALIDCLILPAGIAVEIYYLDRSAGDEVNVHRFEKLEGEEMTPPDAPVLRLLYRPGHYDILYKKEDVDIPIYQPDLQVSFLSSLPQQTFQATPLGLGNDMSAAYELGLFDLPGSSSNPSNFRHSMLSIPEFQPSPFQSLPFQTTTFRNSPFNPSHFQSENFQPEIYQPPNRLKRAPNQNPGV
ncbi:peptidase C65 Otubain-domain-containing protein [Geopyxis carbonaria]|nr:peptidase C65 Otubain-domain-containing protein [Geopyxis carbonaria]